MKCECFKGGKCTCYSEHNGTVYSRDGHWQDIEEPEANEPAWMNYVIEALAWLLILTVIGVAVSFI